ncbi:MAG: hypothetical protein MSA15_21260 [Clostridium sp.]|nr:hypothetical protein [Clostridium sp.]
MIHQNLIIKSLNPIDDGLGGYTEEYTDIKVYGKVAYAKDKMVVTRANEVNTQKLVSMMIMYLNTNRNKEEVLQSIKKGDRFIYNNTPYSVHLVEAYQKVFIITFMEDFDIIEEPPVIEPPTDDTVEDDTDNGEVEDYWN